MTNRRVRRTMTGLGGGMPAGDAVWHAGDCSFVGCALAVRRVAAGGAGADRSHGGDRLLPRGASILRQGGEPSRYLHVIVKGVVELRQTDDRGYWRSSGRTLAAWGPFGPDVTSNSTAWPSSSER
jgi:hypothetical protein